MTKAGDEYQDIVAAVQRALDPGARVRVGEWVEGPDGRRDLDVEVRGTRNGQPFFVLIECKDWSRPVGIEVVDALESKRHDLGADLAVIFSNSGFTQPAIRKASRVGIDCASALVAGDSRVRLTIQREVVAKALSVRSWSIKVFGENVGALPQGFETKLTRNGLPLVNWLHEISKDLLKQHENATQIVAVYRFREATTFEVSGAPIFLIGLEVRFQCSKRWLSQDVTVDVTTGLYDHITRKIVVPDQQSYILGPFDQDNWREVNAPVESLEPAPGEFEILVTLLKPVRGFPEKEAPDIDSLVAESAIQPT